MIAPAAESVAPSDKVAGPDLSTVGREMTLAEIEEAVRQPAAKVKPGYEHATDVATGSAMRAPKRSADECRDLLAISASSSQPGLLMLHRYCRRSRPLVGLRHD